MDNSSDSDGAQMYGRRRKTSAIELDDSSDEERSYKGLNRNPDRQKHRHRSKEERMLGIWAESDSDNGFAGLGAADALTPIDFVAAAEPSAMEAGGDSRIAETNAETATYRSGLGIGSVHDSTQGNPTNNTVPVSGASGSGSGQRSASESESESDTDSDSDTELESESESQTNPGPANTPGRPTSQTKHTFGGSAATSSPHPLPSKDFGKFASSTVWKMMAKMGYTPGQGLGRHGEGRIEPVKAYVRNPRGGIASGGSERPPEDQQPGRNKPDSDRTKSKQQQKKTSSVPRNHPVRRKTEYRVIDELEMQTQARMKEVFVDMTTNTAAATLSELVSKRTPASEKEKLENDVRLGLDLAFARIQDHKGELLREQDRQNMLSAEMALLQKSLEKRRLRIECFKAARAAVSTTESVASDTQVSSAATAKADLSSLFAAFADMHALCQQLELRCGFSVWDELQLERVVTSTMHPHLARLFRTWSPLDSPRLLQEVLEPLRAHVRVNASASEAEETTPLESLLANTLVPRLKQFLFTEWDPMADNMIALLENLPPVTVAAISQDIGSVLQRHVDALDPRGIMDRLRLAECSGNGSGASGSLSLPLAALRVDRAVIPWLPFIGDHGELVSGIRRKLCTALDHWNPSKTNNKEIVALAAPWIALFHGKDQQRLCAKIVGRLETMLCSSFEFNAQKQSVWPFRVLLKWYEVLPFSAWLAIIKSQVLPKFLDYLGRWLEDPRADYAEIADWYWQWRQQYPAAVFEHNDAQLQFRRALVLMASAVARREQLCHDETDLKTFYLNSAQTKQ
ncbi:hypothetical protein IWW45_003014 [Coemansia sp. RSA 485]|nr:hypothetical protein IWW45_003014 [Coemansia sp. RSA 485]